MNILEKIKNKIVVWLGVKKDVVVDVAVPLEQNTQTADELKAEINKLNSRISFMTEKMEKLYQQQEQMLVMSEQILYYSSGSFEDTSTSTSQETKIENGKNVVQMKGLYRLN